MIGSQCVQDLVILVLRFFAIRFYNLDKPRRMADFQRLGRHCTCQMYNSSEQLQFFL